MKTSKEGMVKLLVLGVVLVLMLCAEGNWDKTRREASKYPHNKVAQTIVFERYGFDSTEEPGQMGKIIALFNN